MSHACYGAFTLSTCCCHAQTPRTRSCCKHSPESVSIAPVQSAQHSTEYADMTAAASCTGFGARVRRDLP